MNKPHRHDDMSIMAKAIKSTLLALVLMASEAGAEFCPALPPWVFDDVPSNHPFCTEITWNAQRGVTFLDPNHRLYCPNDFVRRDQMAALMHRLGDAMFPLTCAAGAGDEVERARLGVRE